MSGLFWSCFEVLFYPLCLQGDSTESKGGGGPGGTMWGNLLKCPDNPKDTDFAPGWSKYIEMPTQLDLICMSLFHVLHGYVCAVGFCLFLSAGVLIFLPACINMSLGESFIILRPLLLSVSFMHCQFLSQL